MSRSSMRSFLVSAKQHLAQITKNQGQASLVVGNESADLDSITCALVYGYIESNKARYDHTSKFHIPVTNIPASDLSLRPELTALLRHADVKPSDLITLDDLDQESLAPQHTEWTLVDHNALQGQLAESYGDRVIGTIDHHEDEHKLPGDAQPRIIETSGSCNSLVVEYLRQDWDSLVSSTKTIDSRNAGSGSPSTWDAQVAKLSLGAILIDTANLKDENKTTDHDVAAVKYLEAHITSSQESDKDYNRQKFYDELNAAREDLDALSLEDILRKDYKKWSEGGLALGTAAVVQPIEYLMGKDADLDETLISFARQRSLQLMAINTAYTDGKGEFRRQLYLVALEDGKAKAAAERFASQSSGELQLEDAEGTDYPSGKAAFRHFWRQKNLASSRKQVAPLLRQAMRQQ